jgi:predicted glycoside hydrolase/deacetylase ChbG (UPF0249 family)
MPATIVLCADDYAMTEGVSRGIEELADAGCLSATSAMVTTRHWPAHAVRIAGRRRQLAVGLHFNLTLGKPLGSMPGLAPDGRLPALGEIVRRALVGDISHSEIETETLRQLDAFEAGFGAPPDFIDGHQHVHALPTVREGFLAAITKRYRGCPLLVRNPADAWAAIAGRGVAVAKALLLSTLSAGFADRVRAAGFLANDGFAGVSAFAAERAAAEFERFARVGGPMPLVMCHPGHADAELAALDPLTERRERELEVLLNRSPFQARLWRPQRHRSGFVDWGKGQAA